MELSMTVRVRSLALWSCVAIAAGCSDSKRADDPDAPVVIDDGLQVTIADGDLKGNLSPAGSREFLGIPYAKPPVGDLRWKAPQRPDKWTELRQATAYGKRCAQIKSAVLQNAASNDEDCLYLNVWTPSPAPQTALPVMVWIHGGGNVNGSTSEPVPYLNTGYFYSGENLAANHGVVVVSLNYRLGFFGFFSHPALAAEGTSGNQGLLDQRMAMQWVHDNISKFGGDPSKVTIFGESAGSQDVCIHMVAQANQPLFQRAISESGGCSAARMRDHDEDTALATTVATELSCGADADGLACLRAKSATDLMATMAVSTRSGGSATAAQFGPSVDGMFLPDQPRRLYDQKLIANVPYLLGSNTDEGTLFVANLAIADKPAYQAALNARFGSAGPFIGAQYDPERFADGLPNRFQAAFARAIGDQILVCTTYDTATRAALSGVNVYLYNFDIPVPAAVVPAGVFLGATHGSELTSVFGTSPTFAADVVARNASDLIQRYWTSFAKTGDPHGNGGGDPAWPRLMPTGDEAHPVDNVRLNIALNEATTVTDFRASDCAFWAISYDGTFPGVAAQP